jgi:hypothetical protein
VEVLKLVEVFEREAEERETGVAERWWLWWWL